MMFNDYDEFENSVNFQQVVRPHIFLCLYGIRLDTSMWIGMHGPMEWPTRSPNLTPLDQYGNLET